MAPESLLRSAIHERQLFSLGNISNLRRVKNDLSLILYFYANNFNRHNRKKIHEEDY